MIRFALGALARSPALFLTFALVPRLQATPIQYHVEMTAPINAQSFLSGARLTLAFRWDADEISPRGDYGSAAAGQWMTAWGASNTIASLAVAGSAAHDGAYPGEFVPITETAWLLYNNINDLGDAVDFPRFGFSVGGESVSFIGLRATFANSYIQELSTIRPKPFAASEATWNAPIIVTDAPYTNDLAANVSGFAFAVPEPTGFGLCLYGLAVIRRITLPRRLPAAG